MEPEENAVVIPLVPLSAQPSTEVMLRMLLNREALLIAHKPAAGRKVPSGMVAQASGAFAKSVSQAIGRNGNSLRPEGLYRVILPTGSVARDLVPAVGGGFRGMVRSSGSTGITGHARLIPATAGAGAVTAAGPLIATVGLAVAAEMLAQHQMNQKLDSIKNAVSRMHVRLDEQERSVLTTAAQQAQKVAGYLLDQAHLPAISSASHAFADLDTLTNTYIGKLDRWLEVTASYADSDRVYGPQLMTELVGKREDQVQEFERLVTLTYEALALRARVVVLEKIAAEFSNPNRSLPHVENALRDELSTLADRQSQLARVLEDLCVLQIDASKIPIAIAGKRTLTARTSFGRLARALHTTPDALPLLTESDNTVLELEPTSQGLSVMSPAQVREGALPRTTETELDRRGQSSP
ncbi:hypothetical protein J2W20_002199 [Sinomonas atrocyanea]|uniref:hypothetical protein n=1 Tax=Sinomonas atrocyanea TaxID=37927 RepID=UPI00278A8D6C|nr:hypothetical protein [Sinomonas atrocyanea]MDQ0260295.1 hypothetical protein [Sinomonas atrocyanea]